MQIYQESYTFKITLLKILLKFSPTKFDKCNNYGASKDIMAEAHKVFLLYKMKEVGGGESIYGETKELKKSTYNVVEI